MEETPEQIEAGAKIEADELAAKRAGVQDSDELKAAPPPPPDAPPPDASQPPPQGAGMEETPEQIEADELAAMRAGVQDSDELKAASPASVLARSRAASAYQEAQDPVPPHEA